MCTKVTFKEHFKIAFFQMGQCFKDDFFSNWVLFNAEVSISRIVRLLISGSVVVGTR